MRKETISLILSILFITIASNTIAAKPEKVSDNSIYTLLNKVNPFIGTSNFGTTNPGPVMPNGMMSVSPFNVMGSELNTFDKDSRWWSTPYSSDNCWFTGYSHVNLSGVGCPEAGALLTMATCGEFDPDYHNYGSEYTEEHAEPGYYTNKLERYGILTEATTTMRSSIERYTFPAGQANIFINLGEGLTNESGAMVRKVSDTEIEGMRMLGTFCYNPRAVFPIYFAMRVSKEPLKSGAWKKQRLMTGVEAQWTPDNGKYKLYEDYGRTMAGDDIGWWYTFDTTKGEQITVQMGVSFVSCENAWENLDKEQEGMDFDAVRAAAAAKWFSTLDRIQVTGGTPEQQTIFYTALYHANIHPNILNDINGEYPLMESAKNGKVEPGHDRYTVFSLWDTYRNVHQLMTLVYPEKQVDMVRSMIDIYKEWGWMPKWELFGRETWTMEGDPSIPVIADTWLKGLRGFDIDTAYEAFIKSADTPSAKNKMRPDIDPYIELGYIPLGFYSRDLSGDNSVSHALEYYVADYSLSLLAKGLGKEEDAAKYYKRSLGYKNYYSKETGTLRPITKEGKFLVPFDPKQGENFEPVPGFHEGSAWNYTFYVPHDIYGLSKLMGGKRNFVNKLWSVFEDGLFDPSNEPDIAYPYLFSYFKGEEWRTADQVAKVLSENFKNAPAGIPGNDDTGTMSTWAVFSMMGFYPDCPGQPDYTFTTPVFDKVEIKLKRQKENYDFGEAGSLKIKRNGEGKYIKSISAAGRKVGFRISHEDLVKAGQIEFTCKQTH